MIDYAFKGNVHSNVTIPFSVSDGVARFNVASKKWGDVFFPNNDKRFVVIDARTLGAMMRLFRVETTRRKQN